MDKADKAEHPRGMASSTLVATGPNARVLIVEATEDESGRLFKIEFAGEGTYGLIASASGCKEKTEQFDFTEKVRNKRVALACESRAQAETPPKETVGVQQPPLKDEPVDKPPMRDAQIEKPAGRIPHDVIVALRHGRAAWAWAWDWDGLLMTIALTIIGAVFSVLATFGAASALMKLFRKKSSTPHSLDEEIKELQADVQSLEQIAGAPRPDGARPESAESAGSAGLEGSEGSGVVPDLERSTGDCSPDRLMEQPAEDPTERYRSRYAARGAQEPAATTLPRQGQSFDRRPVSQGLLDDYQRARLGGDGSQAAEFFKHRFNGIRLSLVNADAILQSQATRAEFREASRGYYLAVEERGQWKCLPWFSYDLSDPTFRVVFDCTGQDGARVVLPLTLVRNGDVWTADGRGRIA